MENQLSDASAREAEQSPPPWVDPAIQAQVRWRDGDIVISVPAKSGTTWTMNIVHQLRAGGDPEMADVYAEVPWLELVPAPGVSQQRRLAMFDDMPNTRRRAFKTHSPPGPLPYQPPGAGKDVQYVVVVRNPEEAIASMHPFISAHSDAWFRLWEMPKEAVVRPDFPSFFADVGSDLIGHMVFGFVAAWWPLRRQPNVHLLHYSDMTRDPEGAVREIAEFLQIRPEPRQWPTILECTSYRWMKAHEDKFELRAVTEIPVLDPGAMIRRGKSGVAAADGVTPEIAAEIARIGRGIVPDPHAFEWCYRGGPLP
jgi:aryl sulfotransferase